MPFLCVGVHEYELVTPKETLLNVCKHASGLLYSGYKTGLLGKQHHYPISVAHASTLPFINRPPLF